MLKKNFAWFLLLIFTIFFIRPFEAGGDFYHHVNTGKEILEFNHFPFTDNLTHTLKGHPWVAYAWGSGIILYLLYHFTGQLGIGLFVAAIAFLTLSLIYVLLRVYGVKQYPALLSTFFALPILALRFPNRPEILTYPFLISVLIIDKIWEKKHELIFFLPTIMLLWANFYGSSVLLGMLIILVLIPKRFFADKFKITKISRLFYVSTFISLIVPFINPNTYKTVGYILFIPQVSQYEGEWAGIFTILNNTPLTFLLGTQYLVLQYFIYLIVFLIIAAFNFKLLKQNKFLTLLSLGIFIPIVAFRQTALAAILSLPILALCISKFKNIFFKFLLLWIGLALISLSIWVKPIGIYSDSTSAQDLVNFIKAKNLTGRAFNHQALGSFLSYNFYPKISVFFDTRDDLFLGSATFGDLYSTQISQQSVIPLLQKYKIDLIIGDLFTDTLNYKDIFYSRDWSVIYFNDRYFVAVPTKTATSSGLPKIDFADPYSETGAKPGQEKPAENFYREAFKILPKSFTNQTMLATSLIAQESYDEAIQILNKITFPTDPTQILFKRQADLLFAKAYLGKNDCQNALTFLTDLDNLNKHQFIFDQNKSFPNNSNREWAQYYLKCASDKNKAREFINLYLAQPDVTPIEKTKFSIQFEKLLHP